MKELPLSRGMVAIVDDDVYEKVKDWTWHAIPQSKHRTKFRARGYEKAGVRRSYLHRVVLGIDDPTIEIDHINGDTLDNRRENLRVLNRECNQANRGKNRNNSTGFKGVIKFRKSYRAQLSTGKVHWSAGPFETPEDAARAYDRKATEVWGEFACLNFPLSQHMSA